MSEASPPVTRLITLRTASGPEKCRALAGREREVLEAVEQVAPRLTTKVGADVELGATELDARADRAVGRHLGMGGLPADEVEDE